MLYRNLLTLLTIIGATTLATAAHAQTRVHDLLQERQNQARDYLSQDVDSRGEFVQDRAEVLRRQENTSIALSRTHDANLKTLDQAYEVERQKYKNLPKSSQQNVQRAYEQLRANLINTQRQHMSCTLLDIQQGGQGANCGNVAFDNRAFANALRDAANGVVVQAPQGSGTLKPRNNPGIRIGGNTDSSSGSSSGGRVNNPTPPRTTTPDPGYGGSSGRGGGGMVNEYHQLQMQ